MCENWTRQRHGATLSGSSSRLQLRNSPWPVVKSSGTSIREGAFSGEQEYHSPSWRSEQGYDWDPKSRDAEVSSGQVGWGWRNQFWQGYNDAGRFVFPCFSFFFLRFFDAQQYLGGKDLGSKIGLRRENRITNVRGIFMSSLLRAAHTQAKKQNPIWKAFEKYFLLRSLEHIRETSLLRKSSQLA